MPRTVHRRDAHAGTPRARLFQIEILDILVDVARWSLRRSRCAVMRGASGVLERSRLGSCESWLRRAAWGMLYGKEVLDHWAAQLKRI